MEKTKIGKSSSFYDKYLRRPGGNQDSTHYCPGCGHGNIHKLIAEALEDFNVCDKSIIISPVGCSVFAYYYFNCSNIQVAHGRAPASATAVKRSRPESIVISYQGDGDLAAIGGNNIIQAANRGENITVFFVNNSIYGMTGGQLAPTSLLGQKTTTSPYGRSIENEGYPVKVSELLSSLDAPVYIERVSLSTPGNIRKARKAVRKGIQNQIDNKGFSLIEILAPCPTGWKKTPVDSKEWMKTEIEKIFPLGVYRDKTEEVEPRKMFIPTNTMPIKLKTLIGLESEHNINFEKYSHPEKEAYKNPKIKVAGFGGQGVLLLGNAIADLGMRVGYNVSWIPSYGPEMRGGTANCSVALSENRIGSPIFSDLNYLIAFNAPSLNKFENEVIKNGVIMYDSELISDAQVGKRNDIIYCGVPATKLADELGNTKATNMVMLGALIAKTNVFTLEQAIKNLPNMIKKEKLIELNKKAIETGYNYVINN